MKLRLAEITSELVGKPYKLGGKGGFDCAVLILEFAKRIGVPLEDEWEGFTTENYGEFYASNPEQAMDVLRCWVTSIGEEIPAHKAFTGDILIADLRRGGRPEAPAVLIHAGQDQALLVTASRGVTFTPLSAYTIRKAYRWREGCHSSR